MKTKRGKEPAIRGRSVEPTERRPTDAVVKIGRIRTKNDVNS